MKKIIIFGIMALMVIGSVFAFTDLGNGEYLITGEEFTSLDNQTIANYMASSFGITFAQIDVDKIYIYYNVIVIEPNGEEYHIKNIDYRTTLDWNLFSGCQNTYNIGFCIDALVYGNETYTTDIFDEELNQTVTTTHQSTNAVVINYGLNKYYSAIELRDNIATLNNMQNVINQIIE